MKDPHIHVAKNLFFTQCTAKKSEGKGTQMSDFGTVTDYLTGEAIRPATAAEWRLTADKINSRESDSYTGAWTDSNGQAVYVDGGPDAAISREDIRELRDAAGSAGDSEQVRYCNAALGETGEDEIHHLDTDIAWIESARVILGTRMEFAASSEYAADRQRLED